LGSFYYEDKFQFRPKARNLQKVDFAFCILQLFAVLSTFQLSRSKKNIFHFAFCIFLRTRNFAKIKRKQQNFAVCKISTPGYDGGLTTPPLTECVQWIVLLEPLVVSKAEMDIFRSLEGSFGNNFIDNFRPCQPVGDRVVSSTFEPEK
jgi:hypothetical protein